MTDKELEFSDLEFEEYSRQGGVGARHKFPNGWGVSVVKHRFSYGGDEGLYELAVLNAGDYLDYSTPVTDDVLGRLTPEAVTEAARQVAALPEGTRTTHAIADLTVDIKGLTEDINAVLGEES